MDILIKGGLVLTLGNEPGPLQGYVAIENGKIAAVVRGEPDRTLIDRSQKVLNVENCVVLPGLINSHTHLAMHFYRAFTEERPYALYNIIVPMERAFDEESIYWASTLGAIDAVRSGVTCVVDQFHFAAATARATRALGLRALVAEKIAGFSLDAPPRWNAGSGEFEFEHSPEVEEAKLRASLNFLAEWSDDGLVIPCLGPHAPDTVSRETLSRVRELSDRTGARVLIHCAQSQAELKRVRRLYGLGSVELLGSLGLLRESVTAAHCVFVSSDEIGMIGQSQLHVALNPVINAKDRCFAPLDRLRAASSRVSLGSDCYSMDMFEQMRCALILGNLIPALGGHPPEAPLQAEEVLRMATSRAADYLGLASVCGRLVPGTRADVIVIDRSMTSFLPTEDICKDIVYNCGPRDVRHVVIDGKLVVNGGHLETGDESGLIAEATGRAADWLARGRALLVAQGLMARGGGKA